MIRHLDPNLFLMAIVVGLAMGNLYIYCRFAKDATDSYLRYGDEAYKLNWVDIPDEDLKKTILLIIQNAQRPLNYHGYNFIYLNLETFYKVGEQMFNDFLRLLCPFFSLFAVNENSFKLFHDVQGLDQRGLMRLTDF